MHRTYFHEDSLKAVRNQHEVIYHQCTALKLFVCLMCPGAADPGGVLSFSCAIAESSKVGLMERCQHFAIKSTRRKSLFFWVGNLWYTPCEDPVRKLQLSNCFSSSQSPDDSFQQNLLPFVPCAGLWPLQLRHLLLFCWGWQRWCSTVKWVAQGCLSAWLWLF